MPIDDLKDLDLGSLPCVPVDGWSFAYGIPTRTAAVYFLISKKHGVIYVGKASDLRGRWRGWHACKEDAMRLGDCTLRWLVLPRADLLTVERAMILRHKPALNLGTTSKGGPSELDYDLGRMDPSRLDHFRKLIDRKRP